MVASTCHLSPQRAWCRRTMCPGYMVRLHLTVFFCGLVIGPTQHCLLLLVSASCVRWISPCTHVACEWLFWLCQYVFLITAITHPSQGTWPFFIIASSCWSFLLPPIYSCLCVCHIITSSHNLEKKPIGPHLCFYHEIVSYLQCLWSMRILNSSGFSGTDCSRQRLLLRITRRALFFLNPHESTVRLPRQPELQTWLLGEGRKQL